jgi:hypothetical protein
MNHDTTNNIIASGVNAAGDAEAVRHFKLAIASGKHWYKALLESIGLWSSASEENQDRVYHYLIDGEAFDWLLLAERLCDTIDGLLPEAEKYNLLFQGVPPLSLNSLEVKQLIGEVKYGQYLNYFYGVTVEEALALAVQEEIDKEKLARGLGRKSEPSEEYFIRIYDATRDELLKQFRQDKGHSNLKSTSLSELKEFTYWLFKYRLKRCEKAKIASDTKKALSYLNRQWQKKGVAKVLASDLKPYIPPQP